MRKAYESSADLMHELACMDAALAHSKRPDAWYRKMPQQYRIDFAVGHGDRVEGVVEVKVRTYNVPGGTLILSLAKAQALQAMERSGLKAHVLLCQPSGLFIGRVGQTLDIRMGGRTDRSDWQDVEPVVHLPLDGFKRLTDSPVHEEAPAVC